jgi:Ca2+-binding RTX toxin-like protein
VIVAAASCAALLLIAAHPASAAIKCRYDPGARVLSVTASEQKSYLGSEAELQRVGDRIRVKDDFSGHRIGCKGSPTVTNTDRIKLGTLGFLTSVEISLKGGPFAPGATPEADASPEIEITLRGRGAAILSGGPGADHFSYMTAGGQSGLNVDPGPGDQDVDLLTPDSRTFFIAEGGAGADTIDVLNRPKLEVQERGGPGDDSLSTVGDGSLGAIIEGDEGADRIVGSAGDDIITPGAGADQVQAEGGSDEIKNAIDGGSDSIDCGAGDDIVVERDRADRLRGCEAVRPTPFA